VKDSGTTRYDFPSIIQLRSSDTLNGKNHTLKGFTITSKANQNQGYGSISTGIFVAGDQNTSAGLFLTNYGLMKDLTLDEIIVEGEEGVGAFCGVDEGKGLENLVVGHHMNCGDTESRISGIHLVGGITGTHYKGEVASITYKNLKNYATVQETQNSSFAHDFGGIVGNLTASSAGSVTVDHCYNYGPVLALKHSTGVQSESLGGIVGYAEGDSIHLVDCESSSQYTSLPTDLTDYMNGWYVGGIVGFNKGALLERCCTKKENDSSEGYVFGDRFVGGTIGFNYDTETYTLEGYGKTNESHVLGKSCVGGVLGYNPYGSVQNWNVTGFVAGTEEYVGGVVGYNGNNKEFKLQDGTPAYYAKTTTQTTTVEVSLNNIGDNTILTYFPGIKGSLNDWVKKNTGWKNCKSREEIENYLNNNNKFTPSEIDPTTYNKWYTPKTAVELYWGLGGKASMANAISYELWDASPNNPANTTTSFVAADPPVAKVLDCTVVVNTDGCDANFNAGCAVGASTPCTIHYLKDTTTFNSADFVGGMVGYNDGEINASANKIITPNVIGHDYIGGIAGYNATDAIINLHQVDGGTIEGHSFVGGYTGVNTSLNLFVTGTYNETNHTYSYATTSPVREIICAPASVVGKAFVGGLTGANVVNTDINLEPKLRVSSTSRTVTGELYVGGVIGYNSLVKNASREDIDTAVEKAAVVIENNPTLIVNNTLKDELTPETILNVTGKDNTTNTFLIKGSNRAFDFSAVTGEIYTAGLIGYNRENTNLILQNVTIGKVGTRIPTVEATSYIYNDSEQPGKKAYNNGSFKDSFKYSYVGGLVGKVTKNTIIDSSSFTGNTVTQGTYTGGLAEINEGFIVNCNPNSISADGKSYVGGLVGLNKNVTFTEKTYKDVKNTEHKYASTTIKNVTMNNTNISGKNIVGGVTAENYGTILDVTGTNILMNCSNGDYIGGIAGWNYEGASISNSGNGDVTYNRSNIYGNRYVGGIAGGSKGYIGGKDGNSFIIMDQYCYISAMNSYAGGAVGYYELKNNNGLAFIKYDGRLDSIMDYSGGIAGIVNVGDTSTSAAIHDCIVAGGSNYRINSMMGNSGGITTKNSALIENCIITSGKQVTASKLAGGIASENRGTIKNCYVMAENDLAATGISWASRFATSSTSSAYIQGKNNVGGITGDNYGTIEDCCVHGATVKLTSGTTANTNVGGIVGHNESGATLSKVKVSGGSVESSIDNANIGGLCGFNESTIDGNNQIAVEGTVLTTSNLSNMGGAVGVNSDTVKNLTIKANITGAKGENGYGTGGITGVNNATIEACNYNAATAGSGLTVKNKGECSLGGITGINRGTITTSTVGNLEDTTIEYAYIPSSGDPDVNPNEVSVGGIAGRNTGTIYPVDHATLSTKTVKISSEQGFIGGIVGINEGGSATGASATEKLTTGKNWEISSSHSYANTYVGGIIGYDSSGTDIIYAENNAAININNKEKLSTVGGIVGYFDNAIQDYVKIDNCINYGDINADGCTVGGIIGKQIGYGASLANDFNYGKLAGGVTGGIVAKFSDLSTKKTLNSCKNFGRIEGYTIVGGVVGNNESTQIISAIDCVNVGEVYTSNSSSKSGGIAGCTLENMEFYRCRNYGNHEGSGTFYGISPLANEQKLYTCLSISNGSEQLTQWGSSTGKTDTLRNAIFNEGSTEINSYRLTYNTSKKELPTNPTKYKITDITSNVNDAIKDTSDYQRIVKGYEAHVTSDSSTDGYKTDHSPSLVDTSASEGVRQKAYEEVDPRYIVATNKIYTSPTGSVTGFTVTVEGNHIIFKWNPASTYTVQRLYFNIKSGSSFKLAGKTKIIELPVGITEYVYEIPDSFMGKTVRFHIENAGSGSTIKEATSDYTFPSVLAMPRMQVEYMGGNTFSMALTNVEDYESAVSESYEGYVELAVNVNDEVKDSVVVDNTTSMVASVFSAPLLENNLMSVTANPVGLEDYMSSEPLEIVNEVSATVTAQFNGFTSEEDSLAYSVSATSEEVKDQLFKVDMVAKDYLSANEYSFDVIVAQSTMGLESGSGDTSLTNIPEEIFNAQITKPLEVRCYAWFEESDTIWYGHEVVRDLSKDQLLNYVYATYYGSEYPLVDTNAINEEGTSVVTSTVFYQDETGKVHLKDGYQLAYDTLSDTYTIFYSGILKDNAIADEKLVNLASDLTLDIKVEVPAKKYAELYVKKNDSFVVASEGDLGVVQLYAYYNDEYVALGVDETTNALYNPLVEDESKWIRYEGHRVNAKGQLIDESGVVICDYTEGSLKVQWMDPKAIEYPTTYEYMIRGYVGESSEVIDTGSYDPSDKEVMNYLAYPTDGWKYSALEVEIKRNVNVNEGNVEVLPANATKRIEVKQCLPTINDFEVVRKEDSLWTDISIPAIYTEFTRGYEVSFYQDNLLVNRYELPIEQFSFMND
ncbi:MAG: hypothetical protein HUJ56_08825, partial [Erysipelotrichaceae bacterium]|nr:hypothetical protein [Erysipelotrichaceae bacterium]